MSNTPFSLPAPCPPNPWEMGQLEIRHRVLATMDPPTEYWGVYHERWLQNVGEASFSLDQSCLIQRKNTDGFTYFALWLKPVAHGFPVVQPHISLGLAKFLTHQEHWIATIRSQAFLWPRVIKGQFQRYGQLNFALLQNNELSALVQVLRETLAKESCSTKQMDRVPHISWTPIMKFGL